MGAMLFAYLCVNEASAVGCKPIGSLDSLRPGGVILDGLHRDECIAKIRSTILCVWQKAEFCFIGDMKPRVVGQFSAVKVGNEAERAVGSTIVQQNETCNAFQYRIGKTQCARCSALEGGDCAGSAKLGNAARCC